MRIGVTRIRGTWPALALVSVLAWLGGCAGDPGTPPGPTVGSVTITPASATLLVQTTRQLSATVRDANGTELPGRPVTWRSGNAAVATVDANGIVLAVSAGSAAVIATSEGVSDTATITVATITFASLSPGGSHTCGLTASGTAYCWGLNNQGQLGDGSVVDGSFSHYSPVPMAVTGGITFSALSAGSDRHTCGLTAAGAAYCWGGGSSVPVAVTGGLTFSALSAGGLFDCGVTSSGAAYCWGNNVYGQLGDGSTSSRSGPVAVTGGLTFAALNAGGATYPAGHTCGLTGSGAAYCWGLNAWGQLGNGSSGADEFSSVPVAVIGGLTFTVVSAGAGHSCGLTTSGAAYCWGWGRLGDGSTTASSVPVPVAGGLMFSAVDVGGGHTCGVITTGAAYCWADNGSGQLGDGSTNGSSVPVPVSGSLTFSAVSAGGFHTCGLTTSGLAYCWGRNNYGQLGNGSTTNSSVPVKVAGQP